MALKSRSSKIVLALLGGGVLSAENARIKRHPDGTSKFIAGVPVLNYHLAYGGRAGLGVASAEEEDWLVVVHPQTSNVEIEDICGYSKRNCKMVGHPSEGGVPFLEVRGTEGELQVVLEGAKGAAHFVEPNPRMNLIPDDDDTAEVQDEVGVASVPWGLERIGVPTRTNSGKGVHVYVMDTGIRATHVDFGGRVVPSLEMISGSAVECDGASSCAGDVRGHGTHCAGTAAGKTYGVASQAMLHSVKTLDDQGSAPWSWIIGAFDWLATKAARPAVASASLGGPGDEAAMSTAVGAATNAGVVVVVAAGNAAKDACTYTPARVASAISVGAINTLVKEAYFSNWGSCVDIWAPGVDIKSASSTSNTGSTEKSGTSQACPHVSGGAALLLESSPGLRPAQMLTRLQESAATDIIGSMKDSDTNKLLWVGAGSPPDATPTSAPSCRRRVFCR